jgi:phosphoglycerol transferase MdoB-like AlkP superfamily enzyme
LALALLTLPLLTGAGLRAALAVAYQQEAASVPGVVLALLLGSVLDAAVSLLALTPLLLLVIGSRATFFDGPWARRCVLGAWVFGLGFLATAEWFFWDEFTSRFNHIALDYLIYPHEVFVNIWESYHVPTVVGSLAAGSLAIAWPIAAWTRRAAPPAPRRLLLLVPALALAAGLIAIIPKRPHGNRIIDGLAQNGVLQVGRAFFSAHLDYEHFYRVPPKDSGERDAAAWLGLQVPTPGAPPRKQIGTVSSRNPYDVLVILEESLGAEFVGGLGSSNACTPQLDRWSQQGLLLTNLSPRSVPDSRPGVDGPAPHSALLASRSRADAALARGAHR